MDEIWKDIEGYEGRYQISNYGRVKSFVRTERLLNPRNRGNGYPSVHLSKDGEAKEYFVHRLVAEAFLPNPNNYPIVNHIDSNKANSNVNNLEWTTEKGNMQHASKQGNMRYHPQNLAKAQASKRIPVVAKDKFGNEYYFESQREAAKELKISSGHIAAACRKEYGYKTAGGYEFRYADDERQKNALPKKTGMTKEEISEYVREKMRGNKYSQGRKPSAKNIQRSKETLGIPVVQYDKQGNMIAEYLTCNEATKATGITHIDDVVAGKRKTAGGYIWKRKQQIKSLLKNGQPPLW